MQLKFSKKSLSNEKASSFGGRGLKTRLMKRSLKISGFQYIHLLSSTDEDEIMSWKEESPVFSLTHWIPLGEKIEKPDDDPICGESIHTAKARTEHTNISGFAAIVCDQRAHHIRQSFYLCFLLHLLVSFRIGRGNGGTRT